MLSDKAETHFLVGTPSIWAPEQMMNGGASFASDIWSLGTVIVEMLVEKTMWKLLGVDNFM